MLDIDGSGSLSKHEFVSGLLRLIFSNDWQQRCLRSMEIGMLHQAVHRVEDRLHQAVRDIKSETKKSICELQVELRSLIPTKIERDLRHCDNDPRGYQSLPADDQISGVQGWEPLPKVDAFSIAKQTSETNPFPQTECLPSSNVGVSSMDEQDPNRSQSSPEFGSPKRKKII